MIRNFIHHNYVGHLRWQAKPFKLPVMANLLVSRQRTLRPLTRIIQGQSMSRRTSRQFPYTENGSFRTGKKFFQQCFLFCFSMTISQQKKGTKDDIGDGRKISCRSKMVAQNGQCIFPQKSGVCERLFRYHERLAPQMYW